MLISVSDGEQVHDLAIHCPPEATVGLVADAVCTSLDLQVARPTMRSLSPPGRALGRAERLLAADIHDGHVISIVPETVPGRRPRDATTVATLTALSVLQHRRVY